MSAKKRLTRKELLKKPDEFLTFTQQVFEFVAENRKAVLGVVGVLALAVAIFTSFYLWRASDRQLALVLEQEGNRLYSAKQTQGVYGMEQVRSDGEIKRALEKYKEIVKNYPGTPNAERAQVYIGDCYFRLEQFGDAERNYLQYLAKYPERGFFTMVVKQSLAYVYEAKGDYNKAISFFTAASDGLPEQERLRTFMDIGRCYEEMGKFDFAVDYYQKAVQNAEVEQGSKSPQFRGGMVDLDRIKSKIARLKSRS